MTPAEITDLIDATWPAAAFHQVGEWTIRATKGAGSRVSAASCNASAAVSDDAITEAENAMRGFGQTPLFMVHAGEDALDQALGTRGYRVKDPVTFYSIPAAALAQRPPPVTCFRTWPATAIQREIWNEGGVTAARLDVMERACDPKITILGRIEDTPAGCLFIAIHNGVAMVHAVETRDRFRRLGLARHMMGDAARWAVSQGATTLTLLTTHENEGANALYSSLGMIPAAGYHYRIHPEDK